MDTELELPISQLIMLKELEYKIYVISMHDMAHELARGRLFVNLEVARIYGIQKRPTGTGRTYG